MNFHQSETDRRLSGLLIAGTIEAIDYSAARVRVRSGDWVSAWLPWKADAAGEVRHWRPPSIGEQVMILSPSGQPEQGMAFPGFYSDRHGQGNDDRRNVTATDWSDGAREEYDHEAHTWRLTVPNGGSITFAIGATTMVLTGTGVTMNSPRIDLN